MKQVLDIIKTLSPNDYQKLSNINTDTEKKSQQSGTARHFEKNHVTKKTDIKIAALGTFPKAASTSIIYFPVPIPFTTLANNLFFIRKYFHSSLNGSY